MFTGTVVDFAGVHMGAAGEDGQFYDYAGVHAGTVTAAGDVRDFAGVRIGRVIGAATAGAAEPAPAMGGTS